jgi:hypothetical protein
LQKHYNTTGGGGQRTAKRINTEEHRKELYKEVTVRWCVA